MLVKYYQYSHLAPALELFHKRMKEMMYRHYASELLNNMLSIAEFDMEDSVKRATAVFRLAGIPVQEHISGIYRVDCNGIRKDWRLSELACSLVILTAGSANSKVKHIQDELREFYGL